MAIPPRHPSCNPYDSEDSKGMRKNDYTEKFENINEDLKRGL